MKLNVLCKTRKSFAAADFVKNHGGSVIVFKPVGVDQLLHNDGTLSANQRPVQAKAFAHGEGVALKPSGAHHLVHDRAKSRAKLSVANRDGVHRPNETQDQRRLARARVAAYKRL